MKKKIDFVEWLQEVIRRRASGHTLTPADDPMKLQVGFLDAADEISVGLTSMKGTPFVQYTKESVALGFDHPKDLLHAMTTPEGRAKVIGWSK